MSGAQSSLSDLVEFLNAEASYEYGGGASYYIGKDGLSRWGPEPCVRAMFAVTDRLVHLYHKHVGPMPDDLAELHSAAQAYFLHRADFGRREGNRVLMSLLKEQFRQRTALPKLLDGIALVLRMESSAVVEVDPDYLLEKVETCLEVASADLPLTAETDIPRSMYREIVGPLGTDRLGSDEFERGLLLPIRDELVPWATGAGDPVAERVHSRR